MRALLALAATACRISGEYTCESHDECQRGDDVGFCERSGYCTFTDESCASQRRYADSAPDELAGGCLEGVVTGWFRNAVITNDASFAPIVSEVPPQTITLNASLADGTSVPIDYRGDGAFSFEASASYELNVVANGIPATYQTSAPHLVIGEVFLGRVDRTAVTKPTPIQFIYPGAAQGLAFVTSTGLWTDTAAGAGNRSLVFDWRTAKSQWHDLGLLEAAHNDRLYYLEFVDAGGYSTIDSYGAHTITMQDGMMSTVSGGFQANVTRDRCVHVINDAVANHAKLEAAFPGVDAGVASWAIASVPARAQTTLGIQVLAVGSATPVANSDVMASFMNPYPGTELVTYAAVTAAASVSLPGLTGVELPFALFEINEVDPAGASCEVSNPLGASTGLFGRLEVQGTPVTQDNQSVMIDASSRVEIRWSRVAAGPVHHYVVVLYELTATAAGGTRKTALAAYITADPRAAIARSLLQDGHTYIVTIESRIGLAGAASGDFMTLSYPVGVSQTWSQSFVVN